jgi:fatty acid desaturase
VRPALQHQLPRVLTIASRHMAAYAVLFTEEAAELVVSTAKRVVALALALVAALVALGLGCTWVIVEFWNTPWRVPSIVVLFLLFAAGATAAVMGALRGPPPEKTAFGRLREEWESDQRMISELVDSVRAEAEIET